MDIQQRRPQRGGQQQPGGNNQFLLIALLGFSLYMLMSSRPPVGDPPAEPGAQQAEGQAAAPAAPAGEATPEGFEADPAAQPERLALGSVDPAGGHRMLLTIDNVGAGVERLELSSPDYRDLDDRTGYLGQLALSDAPAGGALVNVVGPGTPAEAAGLKSGDVVKEVTGLAFFEKQDEPKTAVQQASDLIAALDQSKPGERVTLSVTRDEERVAIDIPLARPPLDLIRPEIENVRMHTPDISAADFESVASFFVRLESVAGRRADDPAVAEANRRLTEEAWTIDERSADAATLRMQLPALGLEVVKRFTVAETPDGERENKAHASYHFDVAVEVRNLSDQPQAVSYELAGPNGLPIEGFWYANKIGRGDGSFFGDWGSFGLRDVVVRFAGGRLLQYAAKSVADGDVPTLGQGKPLAFVGVDSQYFASVVIPQKEALKDVRTAAVKATLPTTELTKPDQYRWQNASCALVSEPVTLAPSGENGSVLNDGYRVFAGPKLPELLAQYAPNDDAAHTLSDVPYYGWFGFVAKPMLWLLHFFYAIVGNYGIAIVLLTVCVRGAMFPISRQTAMNMQKMQVLKPELDRITEKYGDDMQKRAAAQQELFRKHNYNPAAGCLPMFLQLPLFMGLYRALAVDVELRQQPLFTDTIRFCSNLSAPDMFIDWSAYVPLWMANGQGIFCFGPFFNLLPLATCGLFLLQQKMFMPEPTNDQARLQQQMMKYMMLFMGLMFFKVPSGLCIYFIASSLWGIAERKMLPKPPEPPAGATTANPSPKPNPYANKGNASNGSAEALRKKAKKAKTKGKKKK